MQQAIAGSLWLLAIVTETHTPERIALHLYRVRRRPHSFKQSFGLRLCLLAAADYGMGGTVISSWGAWRRLTAAAVP